MKNHILAALREELDRWEKLLVSLSEEEITSPRFDFDWSIKDVIAHLWAWQQISNARLEGGLYDREPAFTIHFGNSGSRSYRPPSRRVLEICCHAHKWAITSLIDQSKSKCGVVISSSLRLASNVSH